jgi:hypothetical protein
MNDHLSNKCAKYQELREQAHLAQPAVFGGIAKTSSRRPPVVKTRPLISRILDNSQTELAPERMPQAERDELNSLAAAVIFATGSPFTLYESKEMRALLQRLNPAWVPPTRKIISTTLLNGHYKGTKDAVLDALYATDSIGVVFNETTPHRQ